MQVERGKWCEIWIIEILKFKGHKSGHIDAHPVKLH